MNVDSTCQEMIQQSQNHTPKLIQKPPTKHLDGKVWEVYVTYSYLVNANCLLDGKIVIHTGLLHHLESDAELAVHVLLCLGTSFV